MQRFFNLKTLNLKSFYLSFSINFTRLFNIYQRPIFSLNSLLLYLHIWLNFSCLLYNVHCTAGSGSAAGLHRREHCDLRGGHSIQPHLQQPEKQGNTNTTSVSDPDPDILLNSIPDPGCWWIRIRPRSRRKLNFYVKNILIGQKHTYEGTKAFLKQETRLFC